MTAKRVTRLFEWNGHLAVSFKLIDLSKVEFVEHVVGSGHEAIDVATASGLIRLPMCEDTTAFLKAYRDYCTEAIVVDDKSEENCFHRRAEPDWEVIHTYSHPERGLRLDPPKDLGSAATTDRG